MRTNDKITPKGGIDLTGTGVQFPAGGGATSPTVGRTSTIDLPVLRDFVSIMDFGAKGDARQVTDATITSGTNLLHSSAAAFTSAVDVGKQVNIVGSGAAAGVQVAFISSVSAGIASLVTTHGGSTPSNASTTISSGGTVNYGTLDTTALQNAINAVSSNGGGVLLLPAGFQFLVGQILPKGNVTLWCYGATVYMDQTAANGVFYWNVVDLPSGNLGRWQIRGGVWTGTGKEDDNQQIFLSQSGATCSDVRFYDMHVTNWFSGPLDIRNPTRARAIDNTMINCGGSPAFFNQINFAATDVVATELIARGNIIENAGAIGINVVCGALSGGGAVRYIVSDNYVSTSVGGGVNVEWVNATAGSYTDFTIANNTMVQMSTASNAFAMSVASSHQTDPTILRRVLIRGNTISSAAGGMNVNASDAIVEGNIIQAAKLTIFCGKGFQGTTVTATTSNGSPTLTSVSAPDATFNGSPITGTGITNGTFVKAGADTATWTLSQNATASGTVTLNTYAQNRNVVVHGNVLRCAINPGDNAFQCYGLRNSTVTENRVIVDSGTTSSTQSGMSFNRCGWMDIHHNQVEYGPGHGIMFDIGNDFDIHHNRVYNSSEGTAGFDGIRVQQISGTLANVTENIVIDDRSVHKMLNGLNVATATNSQVLAARNHLRGYTGAALTGTFASTRDNTYTNGAREGRAVLSSGTVPVSTTEIVAGDNVILTRVVAGGTIGEIQLGTISAGTSFVINSVQPGTASTVQSADTSTVYWRIDH